MYLCVQNVYDNIIKFILKKFYRVKVVFVCNIHGKMVSLNNFFLQNETDKPTAINAVEP